MNARLSAEVRRTARNYFHVRGTAHFSENRGRGQVTSMVIPEGGGLAFSIRDPIRPVSFSEQARDPFGPIPPLSVLCTGAGPFPRSCCDLPSSFVLKQVCEGSGRGVPLPDQPQDPTDPRITFACRFLAKKCFTSSDAIAETISVLKLSPSRFRHLFKQETGTSPAQYVKHLRLRLARQLLEKSSLSVKEVMASAGINDFSHFVRDFKLKYGCSPSALRRLSLSAELGQRQPQPDRLTNSRLGQHNKVDSSLLNAKLCGEPS
jgi:AraC-like DNA-binding protein